MSLCPDNTRKSTPRDPMRARARAFARVHNARALSGFDEHHGKRTGRGLGFPASAPLPRRGARAGGGNAPCSRKAANATTPRLPTRRFPEPTRATTKNRGGEGATEAGDGRAGPGPSGRTRERSERRAGASRDGMSCAYKRANRRAGRRHRGPCVRPERSDRPTRRGPGGPRPKSRSEQSGAERAEAPLYGGRRERHAL